MTEEKLQWQPALMPLCPPARAPSDGSWGLGQAQQGQGDRCRGLGLTTPCQQPPFHMDEWIPCEDLSYAG